MTQAAVSAMQDLPGRGCYLPERGVIGEAVAVTPEGLISVSVDGQQAEDVSGAVVLPRLGESVWVAEGRGGGVRRAATDVEPSERGGRAGAIVSLREWSADSLARQVVGLGEDSVALEPPVLVDLVVAGLRGALAGADA